MSNLLRESGSGHPGSRIESTCVTPPAQLPSSSSIPQIVNWNGISCNSATVRILRLALLKDQNIARLWQICARSFTPIEPRCLVHQCHPETLRSRLCLPSDQAV